MACIILGVTGSIAVAYKAADIASAPGQIRPRFYCVCTAKALTVTPHPAHDFSVTPVFPPLRMKRRTGFPRTSNWPNGRIFCL